SLLGQADRPLRTYVAFVGLNPIAIVKLEDQTKIHHAHQRELWTFFKKLASSPSLDEDSVIFSLDLYALDREVSQLSQRIQGTKLGSRKAQDLIRNLTRI